jgi:hypothetical protein
MTLEIQVNPPVAKIVLHLRLLQKSQKKLSCHSEPVEL